MLRTASLLSTMPLMPTRLRSVARAHGRAPLLGWSAAELLRMFADGRPGGPAGIGIESARWPSNPRTLAGRLRRAQTFLRTLGIEIAFSREGHAGHRIIRIRANPGDIVSTVSVTDVAGGAIWK